jgi:hypothetical protein
MALGWGGGLSEFIVVPSYSVFKIPDSISLEVAGQYCSPPCFHIPLTEKISTY